MSKPRRAVVWSPCNGHVFCVNLNTRSMEEFYPMIQILEQWASNPDTDCSHDMVTELCREVIKVQTLQRQCSTDIP